VEAQPSTLVRWKERWLFAGVTAVLVGYVGLWALAHSASYG
jgi:hypothetical protein